MQLNPDTKCIKTMQPTNTRTSGYLRTLAFGLLLATSASAQAENQDTQTAGTYVDSVYHWGSWELGLEPAAGGPITPPRIALSNRPANLRFRPNDNSVFGIRNRGLANPVVNTTPAPTHVPPTAGPGTAPPGGPGDRFR